MGFFPEEGYRFHLCPHVLFRAFADFTSDKDVSKRTCLRQIVLGMLTNFGALILQDHCCPVETLSDLTQEGLTEQARHSTANPCRGVRRSDFVRSTIHKADRFDLVTISGRAH